MGRFGFGDGEDKPSTTNTTPVVAKEHAASRSTVDHGSLRRLLWKIIVVVVVPSQSLGDGYVSSYTFVYCGKGTEEER